MSTISRLPESTTRMLGSPTVITTPDTLVKELLNNSIDAKATSVDVIVSANTVAKVEVRDNGKGIHPDDYDTLARRGHTSKLRTIGELNTNAGKSLGFRGEALASANTLANVTITTKTDSEPAAAVLQILPNSGGVAQQRPTSAPVGTTVSITDLFSRLPVREQVAIKEAKKTLDRIQELLRSYAMARPQLKLTFKVLQSPKQSWSHSPKRGAGAKEAALQIFGTDLTTHCFEKIFRVGEDGEKLEPQPEPERIPAVEHYTFQAFILKPDADLSKVPKHRYFSVDGRPVTAKRGTMKKLLAIYKTHLSTTFPRPPSANALSDCFIRLDITCPSGSYDANIEPSKDDVLFSNEKPVLDGFKSMCMEVYKTVEVDQPDCSLQAPLKPSSLNEENAAKPALVQRSPGVEPTIQENSFPNPSVHTQTDTMPLSEPPTRPHEASLFDLSFSDWTGHPHPKSSEAIQTHTNAADRSPAFPSLPQTGLPIHQEGAPQLNTTLTSNDEVTMNDLGSIELRREVADMESDEVQRHSSLHNTGFKPINRIVPPEDTLVGSTGSENGPTGSAQAQWGFDMSTNLNGRPDGCSAKKRPRLAQTAPESPKAVEEAGIEEPSTQDLNPWLISRVAAPSRPTDAGVTRSQEANPPTPMFEPPMTPEPPILRHPGTALRDLDVPPSQRYSYPQNGPRHLRGIVPGGPYRSPMSSPAVVPFQDSSASNLPRSNKVHQRRPAQPPWSPPSSIERGRNLEPQPDIDGNSMVSDGLTQTTISFNGPGPRRGRRQLELNSNKTNQPPLDQSNERSPTEQHDLQEMFASARRNLNHQLAHLEGSPLSTAPSNSNSQRRHLHDKPSRQPFTRIHPDALQLEPQAPVVEEPIKTTLPTGDPRAYLLRRQKSMAGESSATKVNKLMRQKSRLMPLEDVPSHERTHALTLNMTLDIEILVSSVRQLQRYDKYVAEGTFEEALDMSLAEGQQIENRLRDLLSEQHDEANGEDATVDSGLRSLLKGKGNAVGT